MKSLLSKIFSKPKYFKFPKYKEQPRKDFFINFVYNDQEFLYSEVFPGNDDRGMHKICGGTDGLGGIHYRICKHNKEDFRVSIQVNGGTDSVRTAAYSVKHLEHLPDGIREVVLAIVTAAVEERRTRPIKAEMKKQENNSIVESMVKSSQWLKSIVPK